MSNDAIYSIARDGKTIGQFTLPQIKEGLKAGQLKVSDHYWVDGMGDWAPLSALAKRFSEAEAALAEEKRKAQQAEEQAKAKAEAEARAKADREQAQAKQAAAKLAARATVTASWQCLSCETTFAQPVEPKSGYDTIRRAIILGASAFGALFIGSLGAYFLSEMDFRIIAGVVALGSLVAFLVLLFMFFFEFISSAVHHGIFRAGALKRCPCCSSNLVRKSA